ncbi:hypothetical protein VBQ87_00380 [Klebsiella pneumoniae]|nr:hypothetical protein [Klebsiella pneumoniae]
MTTDITELAQSEINNALAQLKQISEYPTPSTQYARVLRKYILALVEALEKAQQVDEELCKLLPPGVEYMDPPDGGDVTPLEGVRRMVADYRQRITELDAELEREREKSRRVMSRIAELESRIVTVKLPKVRRVKLVSGEYVNGWTAYDVACALSASGIKVEAE